MNAAANIKVFETCQSNAEQEIERMRGVAAQVFSEREDIIVGVNGSLARREFTSGSDVDYFILKVDGSAADDAADQKAFRDALSTEGFKMPSLGGVFERTLLTSALLGPIGGDDDHNETLTRRMLFLLEGEWIFNRGGFEHLRRDLVIKYVSDDLEREKLPLYLLNDIVRYWRTICVDYEHKTADHKKAKPLRLAKLRMSRMILCFAGMIAVAETEGMDAAAKRTRLGDLFAMQALERLQSILGDEFGVARTEYGKFLERLDDKAFRIALDVKGDDGLKSNEYAEITAVARRFKEALISILVEKYGVNSLLVRALLL